MKKEVEEVKMKVEGEEVDGKEGEGGGEGEERR